MNLSNKQYLAIAGAVLSVLMVSTAQLTDLFGPHMAKTIVSIAGLLNMVINSIIATLTGQARTVEEVAAMPGVERISVNAQANSILASIAANPLQDKVGATTPEIQSVLNERSM